ncbi:MAG TPA: ABC transporter permease subunit [Steroidobacteraceae bacterium]|nr:ABC transporter permease subunit [Steroidobacteraceae bacterium]
MLRYALGRLLGAVPTLFAVVTLAFLLVRLAPGGPFDQQQRLAPEVKANLDRAYGLDRPLPEQYLRYLAGLARGDLGPSMRLRDFSVNELIRAGMPVSLTLGALALALAVGVGVPLGVFAALRRARAADHALLGLAVAGIAIPAYVTAPVLALVFGIHLHWLPVAGWERGRPSDLVLPAVALALPTLAYLVRLTRASVLEVLTQPHVRTALAKGLPAGRVLLRHVLPPALSPVLGYLGPAAAAILTGSLVVETVFGLPGMGRFLVQGAINRDYTLVMGKVIVYALIVIGLNLAVDLLQGLIDPRLRRARRA